MLNKIISNKQEICAIDYENHFLTFLIAPSSVGPPFILAFCILKNQSNFCDTTLCFLLYKIESLIISFIIKFH